MKKICVFFLVVASALLMIRGANAFTDSFNGTLSEYDSTWLPPHDPGSSLNYVYEEFTFTADLSAYHSFEVFDSDAGDVFIPVLYLYEGAFDSGNVLINLLNEPDDYASSTLIKLLHQGSSYHLVITTSAPREGWYDLDFTAPIAPAVPIPGAAWLLGSGLLGLVAIRKKRGYKSEIHIPKSKI